MVGNDYDAMCGGIDRVRWLDRRLLREATTIVFACIDDGLTGQRLDRVDSEVRALKSLIKGVDADRRFRHKLVSG